ncbi:MAG: hypothetical protein ACREA3_02605 [Nitrosotalea sp.]
MPMRHKEPKRPAWIPPSTGSAMPRLKIGDSLFILLTITLIFSGLPLSYADRVVTVQTVANVNEQSLIAAMSNLQNYQQIFPDNIRSVKILDNKTNLVDMNAGLNGFFFDTQAVYNQTSDGIYVIEVTSGDLKGTTMTTQLNKTWGFDGKPGMGTIADISLDLKTSGFLSWMLGFIPDNTLNFALQNGFARFVDYAKSV